MRFFESYGCGCVSKPAAKKELSGFCEVHGSDATQVYREDGKPIRDHRLDAPIDHPAARKLASSGR